jgi:excisionase family DNA binding protein
MCKLMNFTTASEQTEMAEVTLRKLAAQRKLEVVRIGRSVRIPTDALERRIECGTVPALPARGL